MTGYREEMHTEEAKIDASTPRPIPSFRVTVEDLVEGTSQSRLVVVGDFFLLTTEPCYLDGRQVYGNGTVVLTIKGHAPQATCSGPVARPKR